MKQTLFSFLAAAGLLTGCATNNQTSSQDAGPQVGTRLEDLPVAVQKAIAVRAPQAQVDDIDTETRTGRTIYEITFADPGKNPKIHVAEDGTLVKIGEEVLEKAGAATDSIGVEFGELPKAVQRTIQQRAPGARIDDIDKEERTGRTIYEITFQDEGKNPKLHIAEDGSVVRD